MIRAMARILDRIRDHRGAARRRLQENSRLMHGGESFMMGRVSKALLLALLPLATATATEGGGSVYPYGLNTVASGVQPRPGHYLYMYNAYFTADVLRTGSGAAAPIDFEVDVRVHTLRYLGVSDSLGMAGGTLGWLVALPYLYGNAEIGPRADSRDGVGDLTVGLMLGWHGAQRHWSTGIDLTLPTGVHDAERLFNPGRNQYAATLYHALTAPIGERLDSNLRFNLTLNGENRATDYRSGHEAGLEYSLNLRLGPRWLAGVNGYVHRQLTDDQLDGRSVGGDGRRLRVLAYGPQLAYRGNGWGVVAKWQHEVRARNKAEGDKAWLQFYYAL